MRRQHTGIEAVEAALEQKLPLRLVLIRRGAGASHPGDSTDESPAESTRVDSRLGALRTACEAAGVPVSEASENDLRRMRIGSDDVEVLGLSGPDPMAQPEQWMAQLEMPAWLLTGIAYAGNAGYAIRCAEVSGAAGIAFSVDYDRNMREGAYRASMHAERYLPVWWAEADEVISIARAAGRRILVIEDCGEAAPWDLDLTPPALYIVGGEDQGVAPLIIEAADEIIRLPMAGFIPSYNLQAAMAMVAGEILRQTVGR